MNARRVDLWNGAGLLLALAAGATVIGRVDAPRARVQQVAPHAAAIAWVETPDGKRALRDASGTLVELQDYRRIASLSLVADHVLWQLCEPERLVAVTKRSKESPRFGYRHHGRAGLDTLENLEAVFAVSPDLVVVNHFGDPRFVARLRERGIAVFDLGEMRGLPSLLEDIRVLGALIGRPDAADAMARRLARRLRAVADDVPMDERPRGIFLSLYGKQLFGGSRGTSYHDVLHFGGVRDAAAQRYRGWPLLDAEQVLALDPDILVTKQGMGDAICAHPGMEHLRACGRGGQIVELDLSLVDDPGPPVLDLAEDLFDAVHGHDRQEPRRGSEPGR